MTPQPTDAGDRCPKCGARPRFIAKSGDGPEFVVLLCDSRRYENRFVQSKACQVSELTTELSRLRERNAVLVQVTEQWRQRAIDASIEAHRIRRTVKAPTEAEDRCITRAEVYVMCADEALAALDHPAPQKPENDDE